MADSGIRHVVATVPVPRTTYEDESHHTLVSGTSNPSSPVEKQLFYRTDLHKLYIYNGTSWIDITGAGVTVHNDLTDRDASDCHPLTSITDLADHSARHENGGADEISVAGLSGELADDQPPKAHSYDKHTDVTRTLFIPCGEYHPGGVEGRGAHDCCPLDPDSEEDVLSEFMTPSDFVSFTSLEVVWISDETGTTGNDWIFDPYATWGADTEDFVAHASAPVDVTVDVPALNKLYVTETGLDLSALAISDYVGLRIRREASLAGDTFEGDIFIVGFLLTYTAHQ